MKRWTIVILALAAIACLVWIAVTQMPDGRLHVVFLDVTSGQGIIVRTPSGRGAVIDGGPQPSVLLVALGRYLPFWQRTLHTVIATHQGTSALQALGDACVRYTPLLALGPAAGQNPTAVYRRWRDSLERSGAPFTGGQAGMVLDLGDGVAIEIVTSGNEQLGLRLSYGDISLALPGIEQQGSAALDATVVALPATARSLSNLSFQNSVNSAILFTGRLGQQALPIPDWPGVQVFSTSAHGTVELVSDGRGMDVHQLR